MKTQYSFEATTDLALGTKPKHLLGDQNTSEQGELDSYRDIKNKTSPVTIGHIFGIKGYTWVTGYAIFKQLNFTSTFIN